MRCFSHENQSLHSCGIPKLKLYQFSCQCAICFDPSVVFRCIAKPIVHHTFTKRHLRSHRLWPSLYLIMRIHNCTSYVTRIDFRLPKVGWGFQNFCYHLYDLWICCMATILDFLYLLFLFSYFKLVLTRFESRGCLELFLGVFIS